MAVRTDFCVCGQWQSRGVIEGNDGTQTCKTCSKPVIPAGFCRCTRDMLVFITNKRVGDKEVCGNCRQEVMPFEPEDVRPPAVSFSIGDDVTRARDVLLVTTDSVAGFEIVEVLGLVSHLAGASGFTAGMKGREAKESALDSLRQQAFHNGATAIVGVRFSAFGAGGGITNVLGGDAVGVLVSGTAVVLSKLP